MTLSTHSVTPMSRRPPVRGEDGVKHCAMNILCSLQHLGCTIPPQADAGWIGEVGPGLSCGDDGAGFDDDFTDRNMTFMTYTSCMSRGCCVHVEGSRSTATSAVHGTR